MKDAHPAGGPPSMKVWLIPIFVAILVGFISYTPDNMQWSLFWIFTFFAIAAFAVEPIPNPVTAVLLMLAYVCFGIAPPDVVFSGWLSFVPWISFAGLCIEIIVNKTGLANRFALFIMSKIAKTPFLLFIAFLLIGYLMNLLIPNIFTIAIVLGALGLSICKTLNLENDSKAAACIMIACYFASVSIGVNFLPNGLGIVSVMMLGDHGFIPNWMEFFIHNFSLTFLSVAVSFLILYFYARNELKEKMIKLQEFVGEDYNNLPPISMKEILAFILLVIAVLCLIFYGMPGLFLMSFVILLAFCPPFNLLDGSNFGRLNFGMLFFVTGCLAIGFTASFLEIPAWFTAQVLPYISSIDSAPIMATLAYFIGVFATFMLTQMAAVTSFSAPLADIAIQTGISAKPIIYSFILGADQWILPYVAAPAIFLFSTGYMNIKHVICVMTIKILLLGAVVWFNTAVIWNMMVL